MVQKTAVCSVCGARIVVAPGHLRSSLPCRKCGAPYNPKTGEPLAPTTQPLPASIAPSLASAEAVPPVEKSDDAAVPPPAQESAQTPESAKQSRPRRRSAIVPLGMLAIGLLAGYLLFGQYKFSLPSEPQTPQLPVSTESWPSFTSPEGRYIVRFPGQPDISSEEIKLSIGTRKVWRAKCVAEGLTYQVAYFDVEKMEFACHYALVPQYDRLLACKLGLDTAEWATGCETELFGYRGYKFSLVGGLGYRGEFISIEADGRIYLIGIVTEREDRSFDLYQFTVTFRVLERPDRLTAERALMNWNRTFFRDNTCVVGRNESGKNEGRYNEVLAHFRGSEGVGEVWETALDRSRWTLPDKCAQKRRVFEEEWIAHVRFVQEKKPVVTLETDRYLFDSVNYEWNEDGKRYYISYMYGYEPFLVVSKNLPDAQEVMYIFNGRNVFKYDREQLPYVVYMPPRILPLNETPGGVVETTACLSWVVGEPANVSLSVEHGQPPYTWTVEGLPAGVSWSDARHEGISLEQEWPDPDGVPRPKIAEGTLVIGGALKGAGRWVAKVRVKDQRGKEASYDIEIVGAALPDDAGSATFSGGVAQLYVKYAGTIDVTTGGNGRDLFCRVEDGELPPGLGLQKTGEFTFGFLGYPTTKGEFAFDAVIEQRYPEFKRKRYTRLPIRIVVEAGPSEPLLPLFGMSNTILIETGHTAEQSKLIKAALAPAILRLSFDSWMQLLISDGEKWVQSRVEQRFRRSDDGHWAAQWVENRDWVGQEKKPHSLAERLRNFGWWRGSDSTVLISPLSDCDSADGIAALKAELDKLVERRAAGAGFENVAIVTARPDVPDEFQSWLKEKRFTLVQIK